MLRLRGKGRVDLHPIIEVDSLAYVGLVGHLSGMDPLGSRGRLDIDAGQLVLYRPRESGGLVPGHRAECIEEVLLLSGILCLTLSLVWMNRVARPHRLVAIISRPVKRLMLSLRSELRLSSLKQRIECVLQGGRCSIRWPSRSRGSTCLPGGQTTILLL